MISYPRIKSSSGDQRITPLKASVDLKLMPLSSAELELRPGDTIPARSLVEMFTENGSVGIFRSKPMQERYGERSTHVELEYAAAEINDWLTGKIKEQTKAANTAISTLFNSYHGSLWTLGTVSPTSTIILAAEYDNVLDAIINVVEQLPDYMITFDQTVTPWTLNVVARPSSVTAEGRLSRNIESVEISRDDSDLCTRVYIDGYSGHIDDLTAQAQYGIIEHRMSETGYTSSQAQNIAQAYLNAHKEPKLSVTINAQDLSAITGETLDEIKIGKRYRLTIPEDNVVIEQIVVGMHYDDVYGNPKAVQVTLADDPDDVVNYLKKQRKSGAGASRKKDEEIDGIKAELVKHSNDIGLVVTETVGGAVVNTASIVASINSSGSSVVISADHVDLQGYVTATSLATDIAGLGTVTVNTLEVNTQLDVTGPAYFDSTITAEDSTGYFGAIVADEVDADSVETDSIVLNGNTITAVLTDASVSGNTLTITKGDGSTVTFSKATSLSGAWSGRRYTVTASPQGDTKTGIVYDGLVGTGSVTKSGKYVYRDFIVYSDDGEGNADQIIMTKSAGINASSVYDDGYFNGRPISGTAGGRTSGVSALVHDFTISRAEGADVVLAIDCTSIYSTARTGYTYGTFTLTPVDVAGTGYSFTRYGYDKLYYFDDDTETYKAAQSTSKYWYYRSSNVSGGTYYTKSTNSNTYYTKS